MELHVLAMTPMYIYCGANHNDTSKSAVTRDDTFGSDDKVGYITSYGSISLGSCTKTKCDNTKNHLQATIEYK